MSSLLKNLSQATKRQLDLKQELQLKEERLANLALESELVELHSEVEDNLEEMQNVAADIATQTDDVMDNLVVSTTLGELVDQTIQTYGTAGIDEKGAELLKVSVEAVLKAAGLANISAGMVPSFESGQTRAEYTTEAEEKKQSMLSRMWTWLIEAFKSMWESVKSFFASFRTSCSSVESYAKKVEAKVSKLKAGTVGKEVDAGKNAIFLTGGNGNYQAPSVVIRADMTDYQKFSQVWDGTFANILKIDVSKRLLQLNEDEFARLKEQLGAAIGGMLNNGVAHVNKLNFITTHQVTVSAGANPEFPMIGAKLEVVESAKAPTGKAPGLTVSDMQQGVNTALSAVAAMKKIQESIDKWLKQAEKIKSFGNDGAGTMSRFGDGSADSKKVIDVMKSLVAANSIMSRGWGKTAPLFLTAIKANVRYIDVSAGGAVGAEPELRTVNVPDGQKAIGTDGNTTSARNGGGDTFDHVA